MSSFIDIHHHLLYSIDDGPRTAGDMYDMLDAAARQRITDIVVTPHASPGVHRFDTKQYMKALNAARTYSDVAGLGITLHTGAEILYTDQTARFLKDGLIPTLAETWCVLVEFSPSDEYDYIRKALDTLLSSGYMPIVAHVERYECLAMKPERAIQMKEELGVFYQVNCSTVVAEKGFWTRRFVKEMFGGGHIDAVASDAHNTTSRPVRMMEAFEVLESRFGRAYARKLTNGSVLRNYDS